MSIRFYSDPHLGLNRTAHTTQASRVKLRRALYEAALEIASANPYIHKVCGGDLFDTESNDESVLLEAIKILNNTAVCLAGNHDMPNRAGKLGSLLFLGVSEATPCQITMSEVGAGGFARRSLGNTTLYCVPHAATQEHFEDALHRAATAARLAGPHNPRILITHCNLDNNLVAGSNSSLNLSLDLAESLLDTFDYVMLGHEHMPRTLFDGRLIVMGNTHPTSFSDISDKFVWDFDGTTMTQVKVWDANIGYRKMPWVDFLEHGIPEGVQFLDVVGGGADMQLMAKIAECLASAFKSSETLLMARNSVIPVESVVPAANPGKAMDMATAVSNSLNDSDLADLWNSYLERVQ